MKRKISVGLIGFGAINQKVAELVLAKDWQVDFTVRSSGIYDALGQSKLAELDEIRHYVHSRPDVLIMAIPTKDNGEEELRHILNAKDAGVPIALCTKGARANFGHHFEGYLPFVGDAASVGGGTMVIEYLTRCRSIKDIQSIDMVLNGTLNFCWHLLSTDETLASVLIKAREARIMEPTESQSFLEIVSGEAYSDIPKKISILLKKLGICEEKVRAMDFPKPDFDEKLLYTLMSAARLWRFVVTLHRPEVQIEGLGMASLNFSKKDWSVSYGWQSLLKRPELRVFDRPGPVGGALIKEGRGDNTAEYLLQGPVAGVLATSLAMMKDAGRLVSLSNHL